MEKFRCFAGPPCARPMQPHPATHDQSRPTPRSRRAANHFAASLAGDRRRGSRRGCAPALRRHLSIRRSQETSGSFILMEAAESHRHGVLCFEAKDYAGALVHFRRALAQAEFADLWSDWAATQFALSHPEEAEIGFLLALEIEPRHVEAACNLAALLLQQGRCREATPWLELVMREASSERRFALQSLASGCAEAATSEHCAEWERFLRSSVQSNKNELSYFETHLQRYLATLSPARRRWLAAAAGTGRRFSSSDARPPALQALRRSSLQRRLGRPAASGALPGCRRRCVFRDHRRQLRRAIRSVALRRLLL